MAYNITLSDGTTIITIPDGGIYETYSIPIVGQNTAAFGDDIATAFLRLLENFSAPLPPNTNPNIPGGAKLEGQLWWDSANNELKVHNGIGDNWIPLLVESGLSSIGVNVAPDTDSSRTLGANGTRWSHTYTDSLTMGGTLTAEGGSTVTVSGTLTADGGSTVNLNGVANTINGATFTNKITLDAASGAQASLNIPIGTSSSTTNGDIWYEADGLHIIIGNVEKVVAIEGATGGVTSFGPTGVPRSGAVETEVADYAAFYAVKNGSSGAQSISAAAGWTFNNTPAFSNAAPFTITNAAKPLIVNLNADQLDGQEGSYYAPVSTVVDLSSPQGIAGNKTFTGQTRFDYSTTGEVVRFVGTDTVTTTNQVYVTFWNSDQSTEIFRIGDDTSSADFYFDMTQSGIVYHRHNGDERIRLDSTSVELWGGATSSISIDVTGGEGSDDTTQARIYSKAGSARNIGYNETPAGSITGSASIANNQIGLLLSKTDGSTCTYTVNNISDIPTGASLMILNDSGAGTVQIVEGTATLQWIDGSGTAPLTGARTLAYNGLCTIRKKEATIYQIWGVGLS